ncbi:unnamed protein product [Microthlaspi erraticum]|uniref:Eukaryotic translation initiation factor 3 subunit G n=1 Tax=Microthlaspi erraticum TaxID=1685480 RepID=A0A6D2JY85_9BRAS|nr:unnamed protein product [Microthlaspi erraticum]CAA7046801.1 unnamed protein product [Microthlaspi erraticum]
MEKTTDKFRWAEVEDDDDYPLPADQVIGPDENGIKQLIHHWRNDEGQTVKTTTTTRVRTVRVSTPREKRAVERRAWAKFGDAVVHDDSGFTTVSREDIFLERPKALPGNKPEETKANPESGAFLMVCRTCGKRGEHWTARCPMKNHSSSTTDEAEASSSRNGTDKAGSYVPPNMRPGSNALSDTRRRNDDYALRVTNLSDDAREPDLKDLFGAFGEVTRAYVALDKNTGLSRGFGFVNFVNREDAQRAINKLNRYGYDNLILSVEWAAPRPN